MLRIGIPGGVDLLAASCCQFWFLSIVTRLGDVDAAAFGVASRSRLGLSARHAFQVAATTLAGQYWGQASPRRAVGAVAGRGRLRGFDDLIAIGFYFGAEWLARQFVAEGQRGRCRAGGDAGADRRVRAVAAGVVHGF